MENLSVDNLSQALASNGFIQVNKMLIKNLGLHEAVIIGELCAEYNYWKSQDKLEDGAFYSTRDNIEENTGISEHYQRQAFEVLVEKNIITIVKKGMPAVNFYKINFEALFSQLSAPQTTSASYRRQQVVDGADINNNKEKRIIKKNNKPSTLVEGTTEGRNHSLQNSLLSNIITEKPKKVKKANLYEKCNDYIMQYTNNIVLQEKLKEYLNLRLEIAKGDSKQFYYNMWPPIINELDELAKDTNTAVKIVEQSIRCGWRKFFPLKEFDKKQNIKAQLNEKSVSSNKGDNVVLLETEF